MNIIVNVAANFLIQNTCCNDPTPRDYLDSKLTFVQRLLANRKYVPVSLQTDNGAGKFLTCFNIVSTISPRASVMS